MQALVSACNDDTPNGPSAENAEAAAILVDNDSVNLFVHEAACHKITGTAAGICTNYTDTNHTVEGSTCSDDDAVLGSCAGTTAVAVCNMNGLQVVYLQAFIDTGDELSDAQRNCSFRGTWATPNSD